MIVRQHTGRLLAASDQNGLPSPQMPAEIDEPLVAVREPRIGPAPGCSVEHEHLGDVHRIGQIGPIPWRADVG